MFFSIVSLVEKHNKKCGASGLSFGNPRSGVAIIWF